MTREEANKILVEYKGYCNGDKVLFPSEFSIHDRWVTDLNEALGIAIACMQNEPDVERRSEIKNAIITSADLSMRDHGVLTLSLAIEGEGWGCCLGGRVLGHGYLGAKQFNGSPKGIEEIMRIMDVVGVDQFSDLKGKYIRVVDEGWGSTIKKFGNIIKDKWFDYEEFYSNTRKGENDD